MCATCLGESDADGREGTDTAAREAARHIGDAAIGYVPELISRLQAIA